MKKLLCIFVLSFSLILESSSVFAINVQGEQELPVDEQAFTIKDIQLMTNDELNNELNKLGLLDNFVSRMPLDQKQYLLSKNPVGFSVLETTDFYFNENGELTEINPEGYSTYGTIPVSDLTMSISAADLGRYNGRKTYTIFYTWNWNKTTVFNYTDKVALSYNDEFQTRVSNNGGYTCSSGSRREGSTLPPTSSNCSGRTADISYGGAAWFYDVKSGDINYGWVGMDVETKKTNSSGSLIVLAKYFHKTGFPGSIALNIGYGTITVSSGMGYDEASDQGSTRY